MLPRTRRALASAGVLFLGLFVGACEKVPLLAPSGSTLTLTSTTTALPLNGTSQLIAQLIEPSGTPPHSGTSISFTTSLGSIEPSETTTDSGGRAVVTFKAGTSNGTATITAISGGVSASGANAVKIAIGTAAVGRVIVGASPTLVPALGGSSTITATVLDINGNALNSAPVSFSTTAGTLDPLVVTSDARGNAVTTLKTSTQAVVTASVGAQGTTSTTPTTGTTGTTTGSTAGQASGTVTVGVAGAPTLVITPPTNPPIVNLPASFTFAVTVPATNGTAVKSVSVNWGDGVQELGGITGSNLISHIFHTVNIYTITATLTDSFGNVVTVTSSVTVIPAALTLTITAPTTSPSAGLPASFTVVPGVPANSGDTVKSVQINWGDGGATQELGAIAGSTVITHVYKVSGNYSITGTVTDAAGNSITVYTAVTVIPVASPTINITPSVPVTHSTTMTVSFQIQVTAPTGVNITDATIDYGDGATDTLGGLNGTVTKTHPYTQASGYSTVVKVTVTDSLGRSTQGTATITLP